MPIYCYSCSAKKGCGHIFERFMSVKDWKSKVKCSKCGRMANQNLLAQHRSGGIDSQMREYQMEGSNGCRLYAASYLPNQIEQAKKIHPGREFKFVNNCYLPVIKNRTDRKKYLNEMGFVEYD